MGDLEGQPLRAHSTIARYAWALVHVDVTYECTTHLHCFPKLTYPLFFQKSRLWIRPG